MSLVAADVRDTRTNVHCEVNRETEPGVSQN
jgi:hypothetical protein